MVPPIVLGLLYVFVVIYNILDRNDHISSTNAYKCEKINLRHLSVDASGPKILMFQSTLTGVQIWLIALVGVIP